LLNHTPLTLRVVEENRKPNSQIACNQAVSDYAMNAPKPGKTAPPPTESLDDMAESADMPSHAADPSRVETLSSQVGIPLSPSVTKAAGSFMAGAPIDAAQIMNTLLALHPEYADGKARRLRLQRGSQHKTVVEWLSAVVSLYNPSTTPQLHGRLVILGLSLLDRSIGRQLTASDCLHPLEQEIVSYAIRGKRLPADGHLAMLLSAEGRQLWERNEAPEGAVPTHPDHPANFDQLGRKAFAEALSLRIRRIHAENRFRAGNTDKAGNPSTSSLPESASFMMHVHGPWGAGKTSLLNFLRQHLQAGDPRRSPDSEGTFWVVIDFNAWQHQRIGPPWWWLMTSLFQQGIHQLWKVDRGLAVRLWLSEYAWRFRSSGWVPYLLAACVLYWLASMTGFLNLFGAQGSGNALSSGAQVAGSAVKASPGANAKAMTDVIALLTTAWGLSLAISRSLLPGSARGVQNFLESTRDPMKALTDHYSAMVRRIRYPVAVFIDDLDRCQETHVIDLLEGIQTMFRQTSITYVVACDRRWLHSCFESAYQSFTGTLQEPGRPLGYLFMDKIFQLSTSVPQMSPEAQEKYWNYLVLGNDPTPPDLDQTRQEVADQLGELTTEDEIMAAVRAEAVNPVREQVAREEAIKRLATPRAQAATQHMLLPFAPLLEPNPRAMKRLVNAYSVHRDINILAGADIDPTILTRWTILNLRWPLLANYLVERAFNSGANGTMVLTDIPEPLAPLLRRKEVAELIWDARFGPKLTPEHLQACVGLRSTPSGEEVVA
jgi:hypothetical protein